MPRSDFCLLSRYGPSDMSGWIAALLNLAMIAATPVDGSHYFSDVIAGLAIAVLSWIAVRRIFARIGILRTHGCCVTKVRENVPNPPASSIPERV